MPEKRFLLEPHLTKVIGSDVLEEQVKFGVIDVALFIGEFLAWCISSMYPILLFYLYHHFSIGTYRFLYFRVKIRRLRPHIHLFGHTHIPIDMTLEGIR